MACHKAGVAGRYIFFFALLGIVPLAERLGFVTEQLALYTNPTTGALLNATFGNVTEVLVAFLALRQNLLRVVQLSLLGSVLSNMLLVLGGAFFFGGLRHPTQHYSKDGVIANSGLLMLGVLALMMPNLLTVTHPELEGIATATLGLSRFSALVLLAIYLAFLYFQLVSHRSLYEENFEVDEPAVLGFWGAIFWLAGITAVISVLSDYLVDAIAAAAKGWGVNVAFISTILLPIVGNAAEHAAAIMFAYRNKMDIAIGVAIGSSTQITIMAVPLAVLGGWAMGREMDLNFHAFETGALFTTVVTVMFVTHDGCSNWLRGLTLTLAYVVLSASFFYHHDPELEKQIE